MALLLLFLGNDILVATYFNAEEKCRQAIVESRWGDDVVCPYCGKHHCHKRADGRFCCSECHKNFSEKVGTIFENTEIDLRKWFMEMYLILLTRMVLAAISSQETLT